MDPEQIRQLVEEMQRLNQFVDQTRQGLGEVFENLETEGLDAFRRLREAWGQTVASGMDDAEDTFHDVSESSVEWLRRLLNRNFDQALSHYRQQAGEILRSIDDRALRGRDRAGGFFEGLKRLNDTVLAGLPFGGILGVMLFGRMQEQEYYTKAQQAFQVLQRSGDYSRGAVRASGDEIRRLSQSIPEIAGYVAAANNALATLGFTGADAAARVNQSFEGAASNVRNMSIAMDVFFEIGQGSAMKLAATIAQNTNGSLRESVELVRDIGLSVQGTGISFDSMLGSVMQVTSALRLQTNELGEARNIAETIQKAQAGFGLQGLSAQRAGAIAASGIQGVAQALTSMDIGLKAVMGQRMGGGQGLDAIMRFEQGFRGDQNSQFFERSVTEILKLSKEIGRGDPAAQYHVLKQLFGLSAEQAQTLMAIQSATDQNTPISKAVKDNSSQLTKAFKDEALKQTTFRVLINKLIQVVGRIGSALLDVIGTGLEILISSIVYYGKYMTSGVSEAETAAFEGLMLETGPNVTRGFDHLGSALASAAETLGDASVDIRGGSESYRRASKNFWSEMSYDDSQKLPPPLIKHESTFRQTRYVRKSERQAASGVSVKDDVFNLELDLPAGPGRATGVLRLQARQTSEP